MSFLLSPIPPKPIRIFLACFRPPFNGLWIIVLLYFAACFLTFYKSQILKGNLPDPDDYMYLVQVMDWVKGQGWYDNIQHRLNPPEGVMIHFSRLAMIPMAGMVLLFRLFSLDLRDSSILMATIYPLMLLGGLLVTLRRVAESLMPKDWAGVTAYVALFCTGLIFMFQPGHVDHHGLIIWIVAGALACALRMMQEPDRFRWGVAAGIILAFGLVIALEILPWLLIIGGWLGLWAVVKGRVAARHGFVFALSLHLASIVGLLLTRPPEDFFIFDVLTYSCVYVFLTGGIAICFAAVAVAAEMKLPLRLTAGTVFSLLCGFLFLHRFPDLIAGPYGAMDPDMSDLLLHEADEAMPLLDKMPSFLDFLAYLPPTLLAIVVGPYFFVRAARPDRWLWGLVLSLLAGSFALTIFYQSRFIGIMYLATVFPLAIFLQRGWEWLGTHLKNPIVKTYARAGFVFLPLPLLGVLLPGLVLPSLFHHSMLIFPVGSDVDYPCHAHELATVLNDPAGLGAQRHSIISDTWFGPELLFRTSHNVLSAPFHMDAEGNLDAYRFFSTLIPEEAKTIMSRRCLDLVVSCATNPAFYTQGLFSNRGKSRRQFGVHFIQLLMGETPPDWLTEVDTPPELDNFLIYKIQPSEFSNPNSCSAR